MPAGGGGKNQILPCFDYILFWLGMGRGRQTPRCELGTRACGAWCITDHVTCEDGEECRVYYTQMHKRWRRIYKGHEDAPVYTLCPVRALQHAQSSAGASGEGRQREVLEPLAIEHIVQLPRQRNQRHPRAPCQCPP